MHPSIHLGNGIRAHEVELVAAALLYMPRLTSLDVGGTRLDTCDLSWVCGGITHPVLSMLTDNRFALSDSPSLSSVLVGLTDLVQLNLEGTRTHTHAHRLFSDETLWLHLVRQFDRCDVWRSFGGS